MEVMVDLSLTRVLCAIYEAGSVSRAASALCITQPTVSHALARLRVEMRDVLFVRTATGMTPTPRASQLYLSFREAIRLVDQAVDEIKTFEPKNSERRFRLSMTDIGEMVFLPPILQALHASAPKIAIEIRQVAILDLMRALDVGEIDFALGNLPDLRPFACHDLIFQENYVCILRPDHPIAGGGLSLEAFLDAQHAAVVSPFSGHQMIEEVLKREGLSRNTVLELGHFTSVPDIIARTNLLMTVPSRVAAIFQKTHGLLVVPLPLAAPSFDVEVNWHKRREADSGHTWMRGLLVKALASVRSLERPSAT